MGRLEDLPVADWLKMNAALQAKKCTLRGMLAQMGVLKREGNNTFDKYKYFSEAQYKELFTRLLWESRLELKFTELSYDTFDGSEKQANGRMPKLRISLFDVDTGFFEDTDITGEGIDKGDKAGYKAYTGALKYYLANTFLVATGDDPETESPDARMNTRTNKAQNQAQKAAAAAQTAVPAEDAEISKTKAIALANKCKAEGVSVEGLCEKMKVESLIKLTEKQYSYIISKWENVKAACGKEGGN